MDLSMIVSWIEQISQPLVVAACLVTGYLIKTVKGLKWIDCSNIPLILAVEGAVIHCLLKEDLSLEIVIAGAANGLLSVGVHQLIKQKLLSHTDHCEENKKGS